MSMDRFKPSGRYSYEDIICEIPITLDDLSNEIRQGRLEKVEGVNGFEHRGCDILKWLGRSIERLSLEVDGTLRCTAPWSKIEVLNRWYQELVLDEERCESVTESSLVCFSAEEVHNGKAFKSNPPNERKYVSVWICRPNQSRWPLLQWFEPGTGKRKSKTIRSTDEKTLELHRQKLESELNEWFGPERLKLAFSQFIDLLKSERGGNLDSSTNQAIAAIERFIESEPDVRF